jgi:ubiquinone/menaquinone biosynthesis C-methylase UbiE
MSSLTEFAGSVPHNYDQYLGPLFFEPYALDIFERLKGKRYQRILELASGTGRLTRHLAELVKEEGQLFATDLNPDMLKLAKHTLINNQITWQVVDAHEIPYDSDFFDVVVCQFGVMFFKDKIQAFREVNRVLKPGGTFLFNTWDDLHHNAGSFLTQQIIDEVMPDDAPDFLDKGPYSFFDTEQIRSLLETAGFSRIGIDPVAKMGLLNAPDQVAIGFVKGSPLTGFLEEKKAPQEVLIKKIAASVVANYPDLQLPMQALVVTAHKSR